MSGVNEDQTEASIREALDDAVQETLVLRKDEMRATFTEWDRRWREDPTAFQSDVERLLSGETVEEYGDGATLTFLGILNDLRNPS